MSEKTKPKFLRKDTHKMLKLGKKRKKSRKWRAPKGIHNKIRLKQRGYGKMPKIGWGSEEKTKGKISGLDVVRIERVEQLKDVKKEEGIIIVKLGKRKRDEIVKKAKELKIKILNKYVKKENATK
jgi:large subunit ribosomal protein L32e